jgi:hypothetical protein
MPESEAAVLRHAAATLLSAAPAGAVLNALKALLDSWDPAPTTLPVRPPTLPTAPPSPPLLDSSDGTSDWEAVRLRVREMRRARGLSMQLLAEQLGMAKSTIENAVQTRRPPSAPVRQRLTSWLNETLAPEVVAASEPTFRGNGTGHGSAIAGNGNGSEHAGA